MKTRPVSSTWRNCVVIASGPSLTPEVAERARSAIQSGWHAIAVNDSYKLVPEVQILYAADFGWWKNQDLSRFNGERWSCHSQSTAFIDDKSQVFERLGLRLIEARDGKGFSSDPQYIHYGRQPNSGFQAVNLALIHGAEKVVLLGFDMRRIDGMAHFFGDHPVGIMRDMDGFEGFIKAFPPDDRIVNATPGSALKVYAEEIQWDGGVYRHRAVPDVAADRVSAA